MLLAFYMFISQVDPDMVYSKEELAEFRKVHKFLESADEITTMAANRVLQSDPTTSKLQAELLAGKSLLGTKLKQAKDSRTMVLLSKERRLAVDYFKVLTKPPKQSPAKCFFPRHSIFARSKTNWLDIQICYECVTMSISTKDKSINIYTGINPNSRTQADKFFGFISKNSKA